MLKFLVIFFAIIPLASFSWGLQRHFRAPDGMPSGMRALTAASTIATLLFLYLVVTGDIAGAPAAGFIALCCASTALFWWAVRTTSHRPPQLAHSEADPDALHQAGPYAFVRHPFYLAYCLFWFGTAMAVGGIQWLVATPLIIWYFAIAKGEERRFLNTTMAASYTEYRGRTGMIVPKVHGMLRR